ncbi:hypothetical protein DFP72DRAFT_876837 [Ephemerocybe angulata]|uniref:Uncharacterized protein n=1 Tax=Ephemerocybe angulata TaxID=980116 RepID=A0A8H6MEE7_9AGAR|nr:hypothetical protein DFP72DRAFT_876837 [Tulosesus angulatus]
MALPLELIEHRILFKDVSVARRSLPVAVTLANKPHLARHVRDFKIVVGPSVTVLPSYYRALATALSHMRELVSLSISVPAQYSSILPAAPDAVFPRLRHLQASFTLDSHLLAFLSKTPGLTTLTLDQSLHAPRSEIPPTLLPHLSSFSGATQVAQLLVPGRPVSSLYLTSGDLTEEVVSFLAQSSASVSTLDATTTSLPLPILETLSEAMPMLENIRLTTTYNLWDEFFNTPFIQNIKNALVAMNHLKSANVSGMLWKWLTKDGRVLTNEPHIPSQALDNTDDAEWTYDNHNTYYHH